MSYHAVFPGKSSSRCIYLCVSEDRSQYLHTNWAFVSNLLIKTKQKKNQTSASSCSSSAWWATGFLAEAFNQARNQYELILKRFNQKQFRLLCAFIPVQILNVKAQVYCSIHQRDDVMWWREKKQRRLGRWGERKKSHLLERDKNVRGVNNRTFVSLSKTFNLQHAQWISGKMSGRYSIQQPIICWTRIIKLSCPVNILKRTKQFSKRDWSWTPFKQAFTHVLWWWVGVRRRSYYTWREAKWDFRKTIITAFVVKKKKYCMSFCAWKKNLQACRFFFNRHIG